MARETVSPVPLRFPMGGLNTSSSFADQPPETTPLAENVRPVDMVNGRDRGSRRPGLVKAVRDQMDSDGIQEIGSITLAISQTQGTGETLTSIQGKSDANAVVYDNGTSAGAVVFTSTALASNRSMGCSDEDNNFYVASVTGSSVQVQKFSTDHAQKWSVTLTVEDSCNVFGIAAFDNVLYVYVVPLTAADTITEGIYRFDVADGARLDAGIWFGPPNGMGNVTDVSTAHQCLAAGNGRVGVVCKSGSNLVLHQIDIETRTLEVTTTVESFNSYQSKLVTDQGGNFYVLTNVTEVAVNKLVKIDPDGAIPAAFNSGAALTSANKTAKDIEYDPLQFLIGMVGTDVWNNAGKSMVTFSAVSGATNATAAPDGTTTWLAISAGGNGGWRLRTTTGANDIVKLSSALAVLWNETTGASASSETMWVCCTGTYVAPSGTQMESTRRVRQYAISGGTLYRTETGRAVNVAASFMSSTARQVFSTILNGFAYFCDGRKIGYYDGFQNLVGTLTADAGDIPVDVNLNYPRLCTTWRNRLFLSGLISDPHNWFASRIDTPGDWDFSATPVEEAQAYAGTDSGMVPDVVNAIVPWTHDTLLFLCDHSVYVFNGDPGAGGKIDLFSDVTGGLFGRPFCKDADGTVYFFGTRGSVYRIGRGTARVEKISKSIDPINFNPLDHTVRMAWDDIWEGLHITVTRKDGTGGLAFWWDRAAGRTYPTGSWWSDSFTDSKHYPNVLHTFDGDDPNDRVILWGCQDGYIRKMDPYALGDDGKIIYANVLCGPMADKNNYPLRVHDLQAELSMDSGAVNYAYRSGHSIEQAYNAAGGQGGTLVAGRNFSQPGRVRGHAVFVEFSSAGLARPWHIEKTILMIEPIMSPAAQRSW